MNSFVELPVVNHQNLILAECLRGNVIDLQWNAQMLPRKTT